MKREILKFELSGISACIRKPESNSVYFTYNNPHKMTILGILGAIIGENGYNYNAFHDIDELPDCYNNLKHLKIAVEPIGRFGNFSKKLQTFNNSVGYASEEKGGNLVVTEQWIENPKWNIYILSDTSSVYDKIKEYLVNSKCEYIPYIGKNEHFAIIDSVNLLEGDFANKESMKIDSLVIKDLVDIKETSTFDFIYNPNSKEDEEFENTEVMPTEMNKQIGYINYKPFLFTNKEVIVKENCEIYSTSEKNLFFY